MQKRAMPHYRTDTGHIDLYFEHYSQNDRQSLIADLLSGDDVIVPLVFKSGEILDYAIFNKDSIPANKDYIEKQLILYEDVPDGSGQLVYDHDERRSYEKVLENVMASLKTAGEGDEDNEDFDTYNGWISPNGVVEEKDSSLSHADFLLTLLNIDDTTYNELIEVKDFSDVIFQYAFDAGYVRFGDGFIEFGKEVSKEAFDKAMSMTKDWVWQGTTVDVELVIDNRRDGKTITNKVEYGRALRHFSEALGFTTSSLKTASLMRSLVHITTTEIAEKIQAEGFSPTAFIDYKYYSHLGKEGIYFYPYDDEFSFRLIQQYAYHLNSKTKGGRVALIWCKVPEEVIVNSGNLEDGLFISKEHLGKVIVERVEYKTPTELYGSITLDIEKGDEILRGKWQNQKEVVKTIGKDEYNNPTINGKSIMKVRVPKLYKKESIAGGTVGFIYPDGDIVEMPYNETHSYWAATKILGESGPTDDYAHSAELLKVYRLGYVRWNKVQDDFYVTLTYEGLRVALPVIKEEVFSGNMVTIEFADDYMPDTDISDKLEYGAFARKVNKLLASKKAAIGMGEAGFIKSDGSIAAALEDPSLEDHLNYDKQKKDNRPDMKTDAEMLKLALPYAKRFKEKLELEKVTEDKYEEKFLSWAKDNHFNREWRDYIKQCLLNLEVIF